MNKLNHIAIIMDGNGTWAKQKGKPRTFGHFKGVENVKEIALHANKLNIKVLTVYAFSTENWKRPQDEVNYLMSLPELFFKSYLKELMQNNIKVSMIGTFVNVPSVTKNILLKAIEQTKSNTGMVLNFAFNYGGQDEIIRACKNYAIDFKENKVSDLNLEMFKSYLMTKNMPDVDLVIRTSGRNRISNFLLFQIAYSELIFIDKLWPDFSPNDLDDCINEFMSRNRLFGGL